MACVAEWFISIKFAVEPFNDVIPAIETREWDDWLQVVCVHLALGEQGFASGAQVQLTRASRLGIDTVFDVSRFDALIFDRPLSPPQGRHDEGVKTCLRPFARVAALDRFSFCHWLYSPRNYQDRAGRRLCAYNGFY